MNGDDEVKNMLIVTLSAAVAFVTTVIGLLPQVYKTFKTKSSKDISMLMLINCMICSLAWLVYSGCTRDWVVFGSNVFGFATALTLIFQKKYYDTVG